MTENLKLSQNFNTQAIWVLAEGLTLGGLHQLVLLKPSYHRFIVHSSLASMRPSRLRLL